ncbi:histone H4 transcription factor-like isoform X2 [Clupea harengus]|nr:histone H4 transcription factor-like isoform X2 [Clupea harengus]XP_031440147.1 histone H4 transcription factor-like isoform X2 [Clupea harengus]
MAKRKEQLRKKDLSTIVVACEWGSCSYKGTRMEDLSEHMSQHLKDHLGEGDAMEDLDDYPCLWRGCEFLAMGSPKELAVHSHFHVFHAKLKVVGGQQLQAHPELPSCGQELNSSNLITELGEAFVCEWEHCDSTFNNPEWFYRHVDMHAHCTELQPLPDHQQALFCSWKGCEAFFKIKYRLREHLRSHTQERIVACPTCGGMFSSNTKFFDHIQRQAQPDESLICGHCDKGFANERLLRDHVRQHVNHIKCPLCDMTCTSLATLKIHIKFRHCDERPFPCDFCESCFKNLHDLRKHMETHNEGAAYHCSVEGCSYSSRMSDTMRQHYRRVHEGSMAPRYKCHLCDKTFSWCYTLTLHLRNKHQLKWPSGHARFRYKKDEDGYMRLNMVRYETVEVTQEIMKNMAKKRTPPGAPRKSKRPALEPSPHPSPSSASSSSSPSSSPVPSPSELSEGHASSPLSQEAGPVYCVLSTVSQVGEEPDSLQEEDEQGEESSSNQSGAVRALAAVARGLGMDVV